MNGTIGIKNYENAISTLNSMQSNSVILENINKEKSMSETIELASIAGVTLDKLDTLSVIHISGTKGKGSTCAFVECILRHNGYTTGFSSSPHLVEVRDRIRINGSLISEQKFSSHFWKCYDSIRQGNHSGFRVTYFCMITIMVFDIFIAEKVDVAIIEVGVGGEYDKTNIIRRPKVVGITSIDFDHIRLLGPSIEQIAWHKAGIMKPDVPAFTVCQLPAVMEVISCRAKSIRCPLRIVPDVSKYQWATTDNDVCLGIEGEMQNLNLALALQCCHAWLHTELYLMKQITDSEELKNTKSKNIAIADTFPITKTNILDLLEDVKW